MAATVRETETAKLPEALPIFPLTGVLLLPGGRLPLQIFEPRYLAMIDAALGRGRWVGMVQPVAPARDPVPHDAAVFPVGCAGRIVSFAENDDGRYLVVLAGEHRFRIREELPAENGFRRVVPDWEPFSCDLDGGPEPEIDRPRLVRAARAFFTARKLEADTRSFDELSGPALVTWLSMACPFGPGEKQALLECACHAERAATLASVLELAAHDVADGRSAPNRPARH
ncbi:MAG: peptidase S16 [Alphaproteobacteria bacterium]|nr:peptidase S16 [Alphaproteobacteria bacterium]